MEKWMSQLISPEAVEMAADRIRNVVVRTPLINFSSRVGACLALKCENLQLAGAFKIRGAYNFILQIPEQRRLRGVITYSSGNHAQAVAYAARGLGAPAVVVMPTTAPRVKVDGARSYGAEVILEGTTSLERQIRAEMEADARGLTMVPPFDHPNIIAGQGTVGLEILQDMPNTGTVYVPIGGGGLIAGIAALIKQRVSSIRIVGVEPVGAAAMSASLLAGKPISLASVDSIADGLLPVRPGDLTYAHVKEFVDDVVTVDDDSIGRSVVWLAQHAKLIVEPSGAAALAAVMNASLERKTHGGNTSFNPDRETVAVISGGNIGFDTLENFIQDYKSFSGDSVSSWQ